MEPIGRWYGSLNFAVHGVMYPYFALKVALHVSPNLTFDKYLIHTYIYSLSV